MAGFCGGPLVETKLWNHQTYPDTTECFQHLACYIFPSVFLMIVSTCRLYHLCRSKKRGYSNHWLASVQTIVCICLAIPPLADMYRTIHDIGRGYQSYGIDYMSGILRVFAMILAAVIIQLERKKGGRYFLGLFTYWILLVLTGTIIIYSKIRAARLQGKIEDQFRLSTFIIHYVLVLLQLALTFVPNPRIVATENASPELKACCASRLTFWWFNDLIIRGYKKPLQQADLFELNPTDRAGAWVPTFEKHWRKSVQRIARASLRKASAASKAGRSPSKELDELSANGRKRMDTGESALEAENLLPNKSATGKHPSMSLCLAKVFLPSILICAAFKFVHDILLFAQPTLLKLIIQFVEDKSQPGWKGYVYGSLMFVAAITQSFFLHQYFYKATVIGMRLRSTICASVYNKSLKLTSSSRKESTVGEIVNLMSVDAQRFMDIMTYINTLWSAPLQILIALGLLWDLLGPSVLAGLAVLILMIPLNIVITNAIKKLQVGQMKEKDKRVKLMSEILNGIKVLKLYAWEESFCNIIRGIRNNELNLLKKAGFINAFSSFIWQVSPFFVALFTFTVYVVSDKNNVLDAEKAFVALSLFNIIRFPMAMLPHIITSLIQTIVSLKRIEKFLSLEELNKNPVETTPNQADAINLKDCSFAWDKDGETITLQDINTCVNHKELVAVVGVVGTGKSSLISGLLGDMYKLKGHVSVDGSIAYVAQEAWIQNATLRDNILFGSRFDQGWYDQVIEACALLPDLSMLPGGDMTEIGEKGINLSGGQKQRVSLARAVYSRADIYLLDDPLSAVDAHVGKHIFDKVIGHTGLLREKTRLLVTHGINFLPQVDNILVIKDGHLSESGSFKQLLERKEAFADFLTTYFKEGQGEGDGPAEVMDADILKKVSEVMEGDQLDALARERLTSISSARSARSRSKTPDLDAHTLRSYKSQLSVSEIHPSMSLEIIGKEEVMRAAEEFGSTRHLDREEDETHYPPKSPLPEDKLIDAEKSQEGRVKAAVLGNYISAMGWLPAVLLLFFFMVDQGCAMGGNIWLSKWVDDEESFNDTSSRNMYLGVYASFGISQGVFAMAAMLALAIGSWQASKRLHSKMLNNIVKCSMNFFDTTPTGRILNRFSKDVDVVDTTIPTNNRSFIWCLVSVLGTLIIIAMSTLWFLAVVIPLFIVYMLIQRFYVATSRQLKRIESVNLSPIYSHFEESIQGAATIRAYKKQGSFMSESLCRVDKHQQAYYPIIISNRWLAVRLEFIGSCIVLSAVMLAVVSRNFGVAALTGGIAGLSISYSLNVTNTLNWVVRMSSELESNIVAVERIKDYSEVPGEADWIIDINRPLPGWPPIGSIVFDGYSVRYREGLDLVLKNISCTVSGGEKIGICGRTGAGKSSLTLALFRILEGAEGAIYIDDVRIGAIGLHDLRNALTIIPQDPVVFSGSMRINLDPFSKYTDDKLWEVLDQVNLKQFVQSLSGGLEFECAEGGGNLSVGQRQLMCLGRALLRHTKILILDEATAAVDLETDDLIQATIKTAFSDCTVLTIAHRLNTIIDYDRVMVLDAGEIKEFSSPQDLLADENSIFYSLAKQSNLV
ncbi:multidrug resistance-associated protein 1-like [Watersipora subatra]|uniref:multidrug resistance-associated protein 1-like n=1 Tax=Watersipora subatra TaxID=2589382 RepID=UPI00355BEB29